MEFTFLQRIDHTKEGADWISDGNRIKQKYLSMLQNITKQAKLK